MTATAARMLRRSSTPAPGLSLTPGWALDQHRANLPNPDPRCPAPGLVSPLPMILEVAALNIRPGLTGEFEQEFAKAQFIISRVPGYRQHEVRRCLEVADKYLLLVWWEDLESHTVGFRQSPEYREWKKLLHHFYDPFPVVEHFEGVPGLSHRA